MTPLDRIRAAVRLLAYPASDAQRAARVTLALAAVDAAERLADPALPGWFCAHCRVFNGSAREERSTCRACDMPRAEGPAPSLGGAQ